MMDNSLRHLGQLVLIGLGSMISLHLLFMIIYLDQNSRELINALYSTSLFTLRSSIWIALISIPIWYFSKKGWKWFFYVGTSILTIIHFGLLSYLVSTGIPLGADLFGYSLSEVVAIAGASSDVKVGAIWLLLLILFTGAFLVNRIGQHTASRIWLIILLLIPLSYLLPHPKVTSYSEAGYYKVISPSAYFWPRAFNHFLKDQQNVSSEMADYPFLHTRDRSNPLGQLLSSENDLPNIIIIAVEGLGADFVGSNSPFGGATPFLDSLINTSLYWPNCLSNTGRTFGVLPTLTGSLPYGQSGFMDYGPDFPTHLSLWSWLKVNGYSSTYFYGGNPNFDNQDVFLEAQKVDNLYGESSFPSDFQKMPGNSEGFSWGYGDQDLFDFGISKMKGFNNPFFSFFMTLTTHEPFVPANDAYSAQVSALAASKESTIYSEYQNVFECIAYTDDALRQFINDYKTLPQYHNSIIIITGDHRLIPVPADKRLDRFHVPLIIHSPMVKTPAVFQNVIAHSQITPTLLNWLSETYQLPINDQVSFISPPMEAKHEFNSTLDVALMRSKNETKEYVYGNLVLSDGNLYTLEDDFTLTQNRNGDQKKIVEQKLADFVSKSHHAIVHNRLLPDSLAIMSRTIAFSAAEKKLLNDLHVLGKVPDSVYVVARSLGLQRKFDSSRLVCRYGLMKSPNFHDLRVLLARTYAWNSQFDSATMVLDEVLRRAENYEDAYNAYSDVAYWNDYSELAMKMAREGLERNPESLDLKARVARSLLEQNKTNEARQMITKILEEQPTNELATELNQRLKNL